MAIIIPGISGGGFSGGGFSNGDIITGPSGEQTQLFFQNDKPTADVANALWSKPTDNGIPGTAGDWVWTGSDWVSDALYSFGRYRLVTNSSNLAFPTTFDFENAGVFYGWKILIKQVFYAVTLVSTGDTSNYRYLRIAHRFGNSGAPSIWDSSTKLFTATRHQVTETLDLVYDPSLSFVAGSNEFVGFTFTFFPVGTAPNGSYPQANFTYRRVHPA